MSVDDNLWHQIDFGSDGENVYYYIDSVHQENPPTIGNYSREIEFWIGSRPVVNSGPWYFNGAIDDIRIYNRALSESEIQELYNEGSACDGGYTEADIEAAREEARQACIADPASCGILVGGVEGRHATFTPSTGTLSIPFVDVPDYFGGITTYSVDMTIISESSPLSFSLDEAAPVE